MTHSHDRTLLASLGFADPDKREPLHDLACEYLAEPIQSERLTRLASPRAAAAGEVRTKSVLEAVISKGEGQYKTTIGFLDLRIDWEAGASNGSIFVEVKINPISVGDVLRQIRLYRSHIGEQLKLEPIDAETFKARVAALGASKEDGHEKAKAAPLRIPAGTSWILATAFDLDSGQVDMIRQADIVPVRLGDGFTKWFEERQQRPEPKLEKF